MIFNQCIYLGNRTISTENPVFIIAEAGVNHNGDFTKALKLIDIAQVAGANAVKFQTNEDRSFISTDLSPEALATVDCVVLTTNHQDFDVGFIKNHAKLIVDLRNMIKESKDGVYKL